MALTHAQRAILEKARALGGGGQAVALSDDACTFLIAVIARDLSLVNQFPELPIDIPAFYSPYPLASLALPGGEFVPLFERLIGLDENADTYFACLAALHKARLKYERILEVQPLPTIDQVGPRGLLQFGTMSARALTGFLLGESGCSISTTGRAKRRDISLSRSLPPLSVAYLPQQGRVP